MHGKHSKNIFAVSLFFFSGTAQTSVEDTLTASYAGFENYEVAVNEYEAIGVASANQVKDNSEFYDYIKYCALYHKEYSLLPDVCLDVHSSNPELLDLYRKYE